MPILRGVPTAPWPASTSARPMPTRREGDMVPLVTTPTCSLAGIKRGIRPAGPPARSWRSPTNLRGTPTVFHPEERLAADEARLVQFGDPPEPGLQGSDFGRKLVAVEGVFYLQAQGVPRAQADRNQPVGRCRPP